MTGLIGLPALARDLLVLWSVLVCFGSILCAVRACKNKKALQLILSLLCFAASYGTIRVRKYVLLYLKGADGRIAENAIRYGGLPWLLWPAVLSSLTVVLILLRAENRRFARSSVTPASIKSFLDEMPCGICYFRQDGQVIFSNRCIDRLCIALTNRPLIDANTFRGAITAEVMTVDGRRWHFDVRELTLEHELVYEMIASDRTELYEKTEALLRDNVRLAQLNRELREHTLEIDDIVRRQEILQAKIDIHDEMNRLLLSAAKLDADDTEALDSVFCRWQRDLKLLHVDIGNEAQLHAYDRLEEFARALGIRLNMDPPPEALPERQRELLFIAAREAIANAAKHAQATRIDILFEETASEIRCYLRNDGQLPKDGLRFTGGLKNLKELAKQYRADIIAEVSETFMLCLIFRKDS